MSLIVENLCGYAQRDLVVPLLTEAVIAGTSRGANASARAWCVEVNAAVRSEICAVPDERLLIERELLQPLAVSAPADRGTLGAAQSRPEVEVFLGRARYQRVAECPDARAGSRNG